MIIRKKINVDQRLLCKPSLINITAVSTTRFVNIMKVCGGCQKKTKSKVYGRQGKTLAT